MFGRKKQQAAPPPPRKGGGNKLMAQMGMADPNDMSAMDAMIYGGDDDDAELEAELAAIAGEDPPSAKSSPKKGPMSMEALQKLVSQSMHDVPNDDDDDDDDVDDPSLLAELQMLSTQGGSQSPEPPPPTTVDQAPENDIISTLQDRLIMYTTALENAKAVGDSSKMRRADRGIKTLRDLLRNAKSGGRVAEDDIPPPVSVSAKPTPVSSPMKEQQTFPSPPKMKKPEDPSQQAGNLEGPHGSPAHRVTAPEPSAPQMSSPVRMAAAAPPPADDHSVLVERRDQYRRAALANKRSGDEQTARSYIKIAKQFEVVIKALEEGKPIDLTKMPPPPPEFGGPDPARSRAEAQGSSVPTQAQLSNAAAGAAIARSMPSPDEEEIPIAVPDMAAEDKAKMFNAPKEAGTVLEALEQRLEKYRASSMQAKSEGNNSKARRMGRIVKQYEDAIKAHKLGKPVDYSELPTPPGFPPIPANSPAKQPPPTPSPLMSPSPSKQQIAQDQNRQTSPKAEAPARVPGPAATAPQPTSNPSAGRPAMQRQTSLLSRSEQQQMFLQERQLAFKREALKAKQRGDLELAKKYLRQAMGFDQMIDACKSGLPIDMSQVPAVPGANNDKLEFISSNDVQKGDRTETYKTLEQELITQIRTCTNNSDHFTKLGDVNTASKFEKIGVNARKDLDSLKNAFKHGDPVPRFHYETRTYTLVKSFSNLGDNDMELTLIRGLNYPLPSDYSPTDLDTYIKYELPYPGQDDPQKGACDTVKGTNNPELNHSYMFKVNRKSRAFLRFLKNKALKVEVYYKRGFFKGDKLLGTATIKLQPLETVCELHDSFDLMDGRKAVGGKIEARLRVREPFLGKQVEEVKEKWLIIDHFDRALPKDAKSAPSSSTGKAPAPQTQFIASIKVLEYEKQLFDRQIQQMAGRLSRTQEEAMRRKSVELGQRMDEQREQLRRGGVNALNEYANAIEQSKNMYLQEASMLAKQGNREKAQIQLTKKKIIEKEVEGIRSKLPR